MSPGHEVAQSNASRLGRVWRTRVPALLAVHLLFTPIPLRAQTPTGTVTGLLVDRTGAAVPGGQVSIRNEDTGQERIVTSAADGVFTAAALPPGMYRIRVEARGFKPAEARGSVEAGTTLTLDVALDVGDISEQVTVHAVRPLLRRDHHQIGSVVTRDQIDWMPLNGRNFLELSKIEPGVIPTRLTDGRMFLSSLGGGLQTIPRIGATQVTLDGASISTPGTVGVLLQISPDMVQEFHTATVNFDTTTGRTTNGAVNIVTRSGTNQYRASGFYLFRNHWLSAYPGLRRDPDNPAPFFERHQFGSWAGGPLRKGRVFYFGNVDRTDQVGVVPIQPTDEFASLGGIFPAPHHGNQFNGRLDLRVNSSHTAFVRYTTDRNQAFANIGPSGLPSSWSERTNQIYQAVAGTTSVLSSRIVNDLRLSYFSTYSPITAATSRNCGGCFGLGHPRTIVAGTNLVYGGEGTTSIASGWRFAISDTIAWQKGSHTIRFGADWEHDGSHSVDFGGQAHEITLYSPRQARERLPELPLPARFSTPQDILHLPLRDVAITVGSGRVLWEGFRPERVRNLYRLHFGDTWRAAPRLSVNYGLVWSYETNALSHDLTKPALLTPILGTEGLNSPKAQMENFSPALGFAWTATADGKTVVRGGAGRYFDPAGSSNALNLTRERHLLSPLGTGTLRQTGANILFGGQPLSFLLPTPLTGRQLLAILPSLRAQLEASLNPDNRDLSVRNLDRTKQGTNLQDPANTIPYAIHLSGGVQRELGRGIVITADIAWKRFVHTFINGIDYNRWNSRSEPIIPRCTEAQRMDVLAFCSNGPLYFDTTIGRARYLGLLVRAEKRFSGRTRIFASYALGSFVGSNGAVPSATSENAGGRVTGFNNDDWFENYGPLPTDYRHILNLSGALELPLKLQLAVTVSATSAPPFAPYVGNIDFNGDGTVNDLLPGTRINQFGRGLEKEDLPHLVDEYNRTIGGTRTANGQVAPLLQLPEAFSFNDSFFTQDLRLTRTFAISARGLRAAVFLEIFNLLNTANLVNFGSDLTQPDSFGQPSARFSQVFGSGGARAVQLGAQLRF